MALKLLKTFDAVVEALGGRGAVGRLVGQDVAAVCNWRSRRERFPTKYYLVMKEELEKCGASAPDDLWGFYKRPDTAEYRYEGKTEFELHRELKNRELVIKAKSYITACVVDKTPVSVPELCKRLKVSRRTLHRLFVDQVGEPPYAFGQRQRMILARKILKKKNKRIIDAVRECGMHDAHNFIRQYQRIFGERPSGSGA